MDRKIAWNFKGIRCQHCGFLGAMLYTETCKTCHGSLIDCPKCRLLYCLNSKGYLNVPWKDGKPAIGGIR